MLIHRGLCPGVEADYTKKASHETREPRAGQDAAGQLHADFDKTLPAPPFIQNTGAETYLQNASSLGMSACMQCHSGAQGAACEDSDMSFMLDRAQPPIQCSKKSGHPLKKTFRSTMAN